LAVYGDLEGLVREVCEKALREAMRFVEEAYAGAAKLLEDAYRVSAAELEREVGETYSSLAEELKSTEAQLESSLKAKVSAAKAKWVSQVLEEARKALYELDEETKKKLYERMLADLAEKAPEGSSFVVKVGSGDAKALREALSSLEDRAKAKRLKLSVEEVRGELDGGFKALSADGLVSFDYTFSKLFDAIKPVLEKAASKALFEEA